MIWEDPLMNFGVAGIFILYLIYDRQVLLKGIQRAMERIANELHWKNENDAYNIKAKDL